MNTRRADSVGESVADSATLASPRVVLDTNVWLDLLVFDDPRSRWLLERLLAGSLIALGHPDCRDEWRRVLRYPALKLSRERIDSLNERFDALSRTSIPEYAFTSLPRLPRCSDPDDQKFVELAVAGGAALLLSRDDALLRLDRRVQVGLGFRIRTPDQACSDLLVAKSRLAEHQKGSD